MFKIIMLVKKKPEFSTEAFIARWQQHSEKVLGFKDVLNIRHYTKPLPLQANTQRDCRLNLMQWASCGTTAAQIFNAPAKPKQGRRHWLCCGKTKPRSWICSIL